MGRFSILKIVCFTTLAIIQTISYGQIENKYLYSSFTGVNSEPILFSDINLNSYDLLNTYVQFTKDDNLQKITVSPFRLLDSDKFVEKTDNVAGNLIYNSKLNFSQNNGKSTFGYGIGYDNALPSSKRGRKLFKSDKIQKLVNAVQTKYSKSQADFQNKNEWESYKTKKENELKKVSSVYYEELLKNSIKVNFSYNKTLFELIGGTEVDENSDGFIDNKHITNKNSLSVGFTYTINEYFGFSANYHSIMQRESSAENKDLLSYDGFSISGAYRIFTLKNDYKDSPEYLDNLFVPSVILGLSFEQLNCNELENCLEGIKTKISYTPFIEFKISPKNQFRLGIPINKSVKSQGEESLELGPILQYRLQLSGKN